MSKRLRINIIAYVCIFVLLIILVIMLAEPMNPTQTVTESSTNSITTTESTTDNMQTTEEITEQQMLAEELEFDDLQQAQAYIEEYAQKKGYDFEDYPEKLIELTVKDKTSIPFVLEYPSEINKEHSVELSDDEIDNGVPLFLQWDSRWGYYKFKNGVVSLDGCAATCFSMVAVYLTEDKSLTPDKISDYICDNGYFIDGTGTSWNFFDNGIEHYGLKSRNVSISYSAIKTALDKGNPIIASVRKGDFTKKGHYIVISGYDDEGFIINDPFSLVNSQQRWSYEKIEPQIKNMWEIYK